MALLYHHEKLTPYLANGTFKIQSRTLENTLALESVLSRCRPTNRCHGGRGEGGKGGGIGNFFKHAACLKPQSTSQALFQGDT